MGGKSLITSSPSPVTRFVSLDSNSHHPSTLKTVHPPSAKDNLGSLSFLIYIYASVGGRANDARSS